MGASEHLLMQNTKSFKKILGGGAAAATLAGAAVMAQAPAVSASSDWDRLAECESGGDWSINTGNGYYGGLQFNQQSWQAAGGSGMPHEASKSEQIRVAENLLEMQGWGAWPSCSAQLGLSGSPSGGGAEEQPQEEEQPVEEAPQEEQPAEQPQEEEQPVEEAPQPWMDSAEPNTNIEVSDETHTIQEGDSLSSIADDLGIEDWQDLWGANADDVDDPNVIFVGQELKLPVL